MPRELTEEFERWYEVVHGKGEGISFEEKVMIMLKSIYEELAAIYKAVKLIALLEWIKYSGLDEMKEAFGDSLVSSEEELLKELVGDVLGDY